MFVLETDRVILRRLRMDDLNDLAALYADPDVRRYFPEGTLSRDETARELAWFAGGGDPEHPQLGLWATIDKESNSFIGRCGIIPWTIDGQVEAEVAYLLAPAHWRRGLGTEICKALVAYGFGTLKLPRLVAFIDPQNVASVGTAMKAGLRFERNLVLEGSPCAVYAIAQGA